MGVLSNHVAECISILGFVHDDEKFLAACVRAITTSASLGQLEASDTYRGLLSPVTHSQIKFIYLKVVEVFFCLRSGFCDGNEVEGRPSRKNEEILRFWFRHVRVRSRLFHSTRFSGRLFALDL